jgi:hypothetical protein
LYTEATLAALHGVINDLLPGWTTQTCVAGSVDSRRPVPVKPADSLYAKLTEVASLAVPAQRWVIRFGKRRLLFFGRTSQYAFVSSNRLSIEIHNLARVDRLAAVDWVRAFFEQSVTVLPVLYARAYLDQEFEAKNRVPGTVVGVDLRRHLPGLYWLNYLGPPYVGLIGRDRLLSSPAFHVGASADGVILQLDESPEAWDRPECAQRERQVIDHLGRQFFFERNDPGRETVAPAFP